MEPSLEAIEVLEKRVKRLMYLAGIGFYQSLGSNNTYSTLFLRLLIESYKALQNIYDLKKGVSGVDRG